MPDRDTVRVAILAPEHALGWTIMGPAEMLHAAGSTWAQLEGGVRTTRRFKVDIVGRSGQPVVCFQGSRLLPQVALDDLSYTPDVVLIPALFEESVRFSRSGWSRPWQPFVNWIAERHQRGALVAAISTGTALLAETGLLNDGEATTHWAMVDAMAANYHRVHFQRANSVQPSATGSRLITTGGGTAWQVLVLLLVARFCSGEAAMELARLFTSTWPEQEVRRHAAFLPPTDHGDSQVLRAQRHVAEHFSASDCLAQACDHAQLSRRTFERRFRAATGYSPLAYLQEVRMQRARMLLESTHLAIEDVAVRVGYNDIAHFRALFVRMCTETPSQYRDRHGCASLLRLAELV